MKFLNELEYITKKLPAPSCPKCKNKITWGIINWGCGQKWIGWACNNIDCEWDESKESDFVWTSRWYSLTLGIEINDPGKLYTKEIQKMVEELTLRKNQEN